jgi:hypothetical protein
MYLDFVSVAENRRFGGCLGFDKLAANIGLENMEI